MRILAFIILFSGLVFACDDYTLAEMVNNSYDIDPSECINITDMGIIINAPDLRLNNTVEMTPYDTRVNSITNTEYVCNYDRLDIELTQQFGGTYHNNPHNITIHAPEFPRINEEINITAGNDKSYPQYNLTIHSLYRKVNLVQNLDYGGQYRNNNINLTVNAQDYKKFNISKNMTYDQVFTHKETNITLIAPGFPTIDEEVEPDCGTTEEYEEYNLTFHVPACVNVVKELQYGETYEYVLGGNKINISAPKKLDINKNLSDKETYNNSKAGILMSCMVDKSQYNSYCAGYNITDIARNWNEINLSNATDAHYATIRIDGLTDYCNMSEKFTQGSMGAINCINRNIGEMKENTTKLLAEVTKLNNIINRVDRIEANETEQTNSLETIIKWGFFILVVGASMIYGLVHLLEKEANKGGRP